MNLVKEISELQNTIASQKSEKDKLLGKKEVILGKLKNEFSIKDEAAGKKSLLKIQKKKKSLIEKAEEKLQQLKNDYDW